MLVLHQKCCTTGTNETNGHILDRAVIVQAVACAVNAVNAAEYKVRADTEVEERTVRTIAIGFTRSVERIKSNRTVTCNLTTQTFRHCQDIFPVFRGFPAFMGIITPLLRTRFDHTLRISFYVVQ